MEKNKTTHFGFEEVPLKEKAKRVAGVFQSVAGNYDRMNDAMSFGLHRLWKRFTINMANVRDGQTILDLAGGTGDLGYAFQKRMKDGLVVIADINEAMLQVGRDRMLDRGVIDKVDFLQCDAQALPFEENTFDLITIAFGLRNVTDKERALASMHRCLKPGGRLLVLEFSKPTYGWLDSIYQFYSFNVIPKMGEMIAGDKKSYQYLVESIRKHPDQETLKAMVLNAGFDSCDYTNLSQGIVAVHRGYKY